VNAVATGQATAGSDVDLAVIWNSDLNPHKRNHFLNRLFLKRTSPPVIVAFIWKLTGLKMWQEPFCVRFLCLACLLFPRLDPSKRTPKLFGPVLFCS
jgi:hypothetical protein